MAAGSDKSRLIICQMTIFSGCTIILQQKSDKYLEVSQINCNFAPANHGLCHGRENNKV
jgi:hypothetical protein